MAARDAIHIRFHTIFPVKFADHFGGTIYVTYTLAILNCQFMREI